MLVICIILYLTFRINQMKKIISLMSLITFTTVLVGCNTVAGLGKDVERGGEKVQNTAKDAQKKM